MRTVGEMEMLPPAPGSWVQAEPSIFFRRPVRRAWPCPSDMPMIIIQVESGRWPTGRRSFFQPTTMMRVTCKVPVPCLGRCEAQRPEGNIVNGLSEAPRLQNGRIVIGPNKSWIGQRNQLFFSEFEKKKIQQMRPSISRCRPLTKLGDQTAFKAQKGKR